MKKCRLFPFLLTLALSAGLMVPFASAAEAPEITAKAALLVDVTYEDEGEVLYEYNAHEKMYPASITKVMTGLLTLEAVERGELSLDQEITAGSSVNDIPFGASTAGIKVGEVMKLGDVLRCALIPSANEACNILAETVSGSISAFVELMNQRAAELGCENTHFANPHGLHDDDHYTTAWDIYLICREAMKNATFREIVSSKSYTVPATNLSEARTLHDTNSLISTFNRTGYYYEYATGIKTGYTPEAGRCLAASATKGDRSLICVVLGCERTPGSTGSEGFVEFTESTDLMEWGFDNFSRQTILTTTDLQGDLPVTLSQTEYVAVQPSGTLEATLPRDVDLSTFTYTPTWYAESVEAPVAKGQVLGTITVSDGDRVYGTLDLMAVSDVERSDLLYYLDRTEKYFSQLWVRIVLVVLLVLVAVLVLWAVFFRKRSRSRYGRGGYGGSRSNYRGRRR